MCNYRLTLKLTLFLFLNVLIFSSCSTKLVNIKPSEPKIINLEQNFIIEGKFQIQISSLREKGNFILTNKNNQLNLRLRLSPFVPEKALLFNLNDEINLNELIKEPIDSWRDNIKNDFESFVFSKYPILFNYKNQLYKNGAIYASLTGSGSTVYGIFRK